MSTQELRFEPMTTGMVLDRAFRLYVQNFPLMIGISAIINIPLLLLTVLSATFVPLGPYSFPALVLAMISFLVAAVIVNPLVIGAATKAVSERYLGHQVTVREAVRASWAKLITLMLTQFVVGFIVLFGMILLIVPGILWALSYVLIAPVAMIETSDRQKIRQRSWELVKGNRGKVFIILWVIIVAQFLMLAAAGFVVGLVFEPGSSGGNLMTQVASYILQTLVYPLQAIAITLLYYDFRIRKEGFDLEMLSQAVDQPPGTA